MSDEVKDVTQMFIDATGNNLVRLGDRAILDTEFGKQDFLVIRTYFDLSQDIPRALIDVRGRSGKVYYGVCPGEVAACIYILGDCYAPQSYLGNEYIPGQQSTVVLWSEKLHQYVMMQVIGIDGDKILLKYGKLEYEKKLSECFLNWSELKGE